MRRGVMIVVLIAVLVASGVLAFPSARCALFVRNVGDEWIAFERTDGLYVMDRQGNGQCKISETKFMAAAWSPDGRQLVGVNFSDETLVLMGANGSGERVLATDASVMDGEWVKPRWSPDGTQILYVSGTDTTSKLVMLDVASGEQRTLAEELEAGAPAWSADGALIAFLTQDGGLYTVRPDGSQLTQLANDAEIHRPPDWSPDNTRLLYMNTDYDIVILERDGENPMVLVTDNGSSMPLAYQPQWSADGELIGTRIVGVSSYDVYTIKPLTGTLDVISLSGAGLDVMWTADGEEMIYTGGSAPLEDDRAIYAVDVSERTTRMLAPGYEPVVRE